MLFVVFMSVGTSCENAAFSMEAVIASSVQEAIQKCQPPQAGVTTIIHVFQPPTLLISAKSEDRYMGTAILAQWHAANKPYLVHTQVLE